MTTDFRALCVELTDCLEKADWPHQRKVVFQQWIDIAHAALAEPEPEVPTDEELLQVFDTVCLSEGGTVDEIHLRGLRAILARWGNRQGILDSSTPQPAAGEVTELVELIRQSIASAWEPAALMLGNMTAGELTRAAELLEQLNPPQPVSVSERLPELSDLDENGRCWVYQNQTSTTHWLPAHALPLPS